MNPYLTLEELETIAWQFREHGVSIIAYGDEWHLRVPIAGVETIYRAHRVPAVSA